MLFALPLFDTLIMDDKIKVTGASVVFSTKKPPPYNPLNRPRISYKKPISAIVMFVIGIVLLIFLPYDFLLKKWIAISAFVILYISVVFKKALIWSIHLYQNKASDKTRLRCVFEPSCSEYMLGAIGKYGAIVGVFKGIKRLLRCHPPNGGEDYP